MSTGCTPEGTNSTRQALQYRAIYCCIKQKERHTLLRLCLSVL